jgi:hypothetical protein
MPTQLIAVVRRSSMVLDAPSSSTKPSLDINSGKSQKSYMAEFHRNVTVS